MNDSAAKSCSAPEAHWAGFLFALVLLVGSLETRAHDLFTAYVQHKIGLTLGPKHVDVAVDLTFFEEWSARERSKMDADSNGRITKAEQESYLKQLATQLSGQVRLRVAGEQHDLALLYEPELELLGDDQARPGHHRLRVVFFAAAPARLKAGDELVIEDALWREAKALGTIEAEGRDGFVLKAANAKDPAFPPARDGEARVFKARLMGVAGEKVTSRSGRDPCHGSNFEFRISNFPEWGISPKSTRDLVDYNRSPFARIDS